MPGDKPSSSSSPKPVAKVRGASFLGLSSFVLWVLFGACFSLAFAAADPFLRSLLVFLILAWAVLGPFALSFFLVEVSSWLLQQGHYKASCTVARLGTSVDNSVVPLVNLVGMVDSPLAVLNLLNEASALMCLCQFQLAKAKLDVALDKAQGALGWDNHLTQIVVGQLASCLVYLAQFDQAEQYFRRAIAAKTALLKASDDCNEHGDLPVIAGLAMDRFGLGNLMEKQLRIDQAESQYKQAIETIEKHVFEETDFLANHLNALGDLYVKLGKLEEGAESIFRAFNIRKEMFPANHIALSSSYHSLGCLCLKQGNLYESKRYLNDALKIKETFLGTDHPDVADTYRATGELETALNNFKKAEEYLSKSLNIMDRTFGTHPDLAHVLESFSRLYEKSGNLKDAEQYNERASEIRRTFKHG